MNFRYGLMNRPPMLGGLPSRLEYVWDRNFTDPANPRIRHGVITCRELTAKEIYDFELIDLNIIEVLKSFVIKLSDSDGHFLFFCQANSEEHAYEQAENAYPDGMIDSVKAVSE